MSFDDDEVKGPTRKIGLKKANPASPPNSNTPEVKANFEKKAEATFSKIEDYKSQIWDLSVKYKSFIESKVLPDNKGPIVSNLEKEVLEKLMILASDMNEDETQQQGIGSNALCMLLMKCMLLQRDNINILTFKVDQLNKKLAGLEKPKPE
jgi:hypothetical protein